MNKVIEIIENKNGLKILYKSSNLSEMCKALNCLELQLKNKDKLTYLESRLFDEIKYTAGSFYKIMDSRY